MNFNASEAKLLKRILRTVLSRMEGRTKAGLWAAHDEIPAYHKETILPHRTVLIDLTPEEMSRLERMVAPGRVDPLTAREEGMADEMDKFIADMGKPMTNRSRSLNEWLDRFAEIAGKVKAK